MRHKLALEQEGTKPARAGYTPSMSTDEEQDDIVHLPIEDELDLHTFRPKEILDVVDAYLEEAAASGFREVRIVHGKGIGFQRDRVQTFLAGHPLVDSYWDAPAHRGHWGATFVRLQTAPTNSPKDT